jgi:hypothetical protein
MEWWAMACDWQKHKTTAAVRYFSNLEKSLVSLMPMKFPPEKT